jgi:uncharacterized protein YaiE (UPF0345 family)
LEKGQDAMIKVNEYFEGKVKSLGFNAGGQEYTAGVILAGSYEFGTEKEEHLTLSLGRVSIRLPDQEWRTVTAGELIIIPAGITFDIRTDDTAAYICLYK